MRASTGILFVFICIAGIFTGCWGAGSSSATRPGSESEAVQDRELKSDNQYLEAPIAEENLSPSTGSLGAGGPMAADGTGMGLPAGGSAMPNAEPYDLTFFENYGVNPFIATEDENASTFGMDVDTASYTIVRRWIMDGNLPDKDSIRTEEFINYFDQDYTEPGRNDVFSITTEGAESEFGQPNYHLLRIGIKARDVKLADRPPANMIFVVDISGSMDREDRLEQVKRSLTMLAGNLKRGDRIGLVVYGSTGRVISDLTSNHDAILNSIAELVPGGSTNAEQGLTLAYEMARRGFEEEKVNRIILCSDGVANVGNTAADDILAQIKSDAVDGITLTTIGFGMGNYNDVMMEKLANHGDGMYFYIDTDTEAGRVFGDGATQMLLPLASDAKVQVIFNEETVERYRLLGYENRRLNREDFEDDTIDAGEVGAGQSVTALYEIRIKDEALRDGRAEIAVVKIRYMSCETGEIETDETAVRVSDMTQEFESASDRFRFTACVAEFAEILKGSYWAEESSFSDVLAVMRGTAEDEKETEFVELVNRAIQLEDQ